jgi:DNA-3-methyladenine glycosylase II
MILQLVGPFDLPLSLEAGAIFYPRGEPVQRTLRAAAETGKGPAVVEIAQLPGTPARIAVSVCATGANAIPQLRALAHRLVSADLDLGPFYRLAIPDPVMAPIIASLAGLKPLQPATAFEAAVIAITEQQVSMAAAYRIRSRLVHRLGQRVGDLWLFPSATRFAHTPATELAGCGLSRQKIGYLTALARSIATGELDMESMRGDPDDELRARLSNIRGFGRWSVEHLLLHGFGRPGALPASDVSLQKVIGRYFAAGRRLTPEQLEQALSPFRPYQGLAAFYLSVADRRRDTQARVGTALVS